MRSWLEVTVAVPAAAADAVANRLLDLGAPGTIEEEDADGRLRLRAHFAPGGDGERLERAVRRFLAELEGDFPGTAGASVSVGSVEEENWAEGWRQSFPPLEIGSSLRVRPPWEPASDARHDLVIEPAMAFGTGQHASTVGCLLALEERIPSAPGPVLDVGTGSGILAIAAAKLGAARVVAVDDDPIAVAAAAANAAANGVAGAVEVRRARADEVSGTFSTIVANLFANLLEELAPRFTALAAPSGVLVVAGLLDRDGERVEAAFRAAGWRVDGRRSIDGWTTLRARRD